jgi:protein ImuA
MQLVSCHDGKLIKVDSTGLGGLAPERSFATGLKALDALLPGGAWARGVVHEVLWEKSDARPLFFAGWVARAASAATTSSNAHGTRSVGSDSSNARVVWCDPQKEIYPPALAALGIPLEQLFLLRPKTGEEEIWAIAECLGCRGVGVTVAQPPPLSRVEARRLQLAAERGGGVGILIRPHATAASQHHAAATRWLVRPARGERTVQRWTVELIYGHGGLLHKPIYLECSRDGWREQTDRVRAVDRLADRPGEAERARRGARRTG